MSKIKVGIFIAIFFLVVGVVGSILSFPTANNIHPSVNEELINSEGITQINIKTTNSEVQLVPTKSNSIKVQLQSNNSKEKLTTSVKDSTISINVKSNAWQFFSLDFFSQTPALIVNLPEHAYDSLQIKSDNGDILMDKITAEQINAKTSNGSIILSEIDANVTDFKTSNGKVILTNIQGDISGKTSNGSITYNADDLLQAIDFHTSNGKINIIMTTELTNNTLDLRTDFGKIRVFDSSDWDTVTGNGKYLTKLRTNNGNITIKNNK